MKRCLTSFIINEYNYNQYEIFLHIHYTFTTVGIIKEIDNNKC